MRESNFWAMGTEIQILTDVEDPGVDTLHVAHEARRRIEHLEDLLSRFKPTSDISRVNAAPGTWVPVHADSVSMLVLAKAAFEETRGLFNPCMGGVIEALGYSVSFESLSSLNEENQRRPVFELPYMFPVHCPFDVNVNERLVQVEPGYKIDLGGIAKGWIANEAATVLRENGVTRFLLNAGGDVICEGADTPWSVGIANPENPETVMLTLDVQNLSLATSGIYRRRWEREGKVVHHILDPFLGHPAETDIVSSTVLHEDIVQAEVMAKVALIVGSAAASEWLSGQSCKGWVFVSREGEVMRSWN